MILTVRINLETGNAPKYSANCVPLTEADYLKVVSQRDAKKLLKGGQYKSNILMKNMVGNIFFFENTGLLNIVS